MNVIRSVLALVWLEAANCTRARPQWARKPKRLALSASTQRPPERLALVSVVTFLPSTKNVTLAIRRPLTLAATAPVAQLRGPRRRAEPGRIRTGLTPWPGRGVTAGGTGLTGATGLTGGLGLTGCVSVVSNVSSSLASWTSATLWTAVWPALVCTWQV